MIHRHASERAHTRPRDRRNAPRVQAVQTLHGHIVTINAPMRVRELSLGGFSIESPFDFGVDTELDFQLSLREGEVFRVRGRVSYCRHREGSEPRSFVTGVSVADDGTGKAAIALASLLDEMTAALSFDTV